MENQNLKELEIKNLPYPLCVRTRPGMYIGTVANPSKLISEIIDNSCDEVYEGGNDVIWVHHVNDYYIVADRGRGIPVKTAIISEIEESTGKLVSYQGNITQAEFSMNSLHAGSKFNKTGIQSGLNGVGSSVTSALSENYILLVTLGKDNERVSSMPDTLIKEYNKNKNVTYHYIWYSRGLFKARGFCNISDVKSLFGIDLKIDFNPSTLVMFKPDKEIFDTIQGSYPTNLKFVKKIAEYNKKKLDIIIEGKRNEDELKSFGFDFTVVLTSPYKGKVADDRLRNPKLEIIASIGVNPNWGCRDCIGSVNGLHTPNGIHCKMLEKAFRNAWTRHYGDAFGTELSSLNYYILAICNNPVFDSQTKVRLDQVPDIDIRNLDMLETKIIQAFKKNSEVWDLYAEKVRTQIKDVKNLSKINLIKTKIVIAADNPKAEMFMPKKLIDAATKIRNEAELYVCEGDSAAGGFIKARDANKHAILPLRGRPLNTVYMDITEVLKNQEMCDFITCTGVGVNDYHSLAKVRYGKIIIATDMDPDGAAIASSILCTVIDHQRFLIDAGYVYICLSPFFIQGNNYYYFAEDFDKLDKNKPFTRIKGLGELNPSQIKDSILNPAKRVLIKVTSDKVNNALDLLTRTGARRQLLMDEGIISDAYLDRHLMSELDNQ